MMRRIHERSPRAVARTTGAVYLLYFLTAVLGEFLTRSAGISGIGGVPDDPASTANLILANQSSMRAGFAIDLVSIGCYVALTGLLYQLFKPVNRSVAYVAALFSLVATAVEASSSVFLVAPLVVLSGSP